MKKVGIVTICDNNNYGNRLQNYALGLIIKKLDFEVETIINNPFYNQKKGKIETIIRIIYFNIKIRKKEKSQRVDNFKKFNKNINFSNYIFTNFNIRKLSKYDAIVVGSDQVWNPNFGRLSDLDILNFKNINNKISYAASFGIANLPEYIDREYLKKSLQDFSSISVREEAGKKIVEEITSREGVEVLLDPTMLLTNEEWTLVIKEPKIEVPKKYILNYFLGNLSDERRKEIMRVADENDCKIINILDKNDPFYCSGPSEFLYLEKNAFLICTDSFHSSVFSVIFDRPFIVFERDDNTQNMSSRIDTLMSKLQLVDRKFDGKILSKQINHDYTNAYALLEIERKKSINFLRKSIGE